MNTELKTRLEYLRLNMLDNFKLYGMTEQDDRKEFYERLVKYDLRRMLAMKFDGMMQTITK